MATVIAIGSMFYSTISGVIAEFEELKVRAKGDELVISARLVNCFSEDLDTIFKSGREIRIYYHVELLDATDGNPVEERTFYHAIRYSLVEDVYEIFHSNNEGRTAGLTLERAKEMMSVIDDVAVFPSSGLSSGTPYTVKITAYIEKIRLPGMDEELNLMFYWNSLRPTVTSGPFTKDLFKQ